MSEEEMKLFRQLIDNYSVSDSLYCVLGDGKVREYKFRGIRIQKGYKPQIMGWHMNDMKGEEVPITTLDNLNKKVFVYYEDAKSKLILR